MARYIKANPLVARFLNLDNERNTVSDGNYLFWQADMLKFGPLTQLNDILVKIGGLALSPHEAREEQDGTVCRQLPLATDARFQQPIKANVNDARFQQPIKANVNDAVVTPSQGSEAEEQPSTDTDNNGSETEGQAPEQGNEEAAEGDAETDSDPDTAGQESEQTKSETDK